MAKKRKDLETLLDVLLEPPDVPDEEPVEGGKIYSAAVATHI
jgi:hypothetical protein